MTIQQNYPAIKSSLNLDFANTKQLDPRITYSRASTGTYYDGKTVAKAEENLLTYSQDFVSWTEANGCTVTADSTAAPDGTTTADLLIPSTASLSYHVRTSNSFTTQAASILSVYVKPSGYNYLSVVVSSNTGRANIEVSTGSITNYGTNAFTVNSIALANGWYRLVITVPVAFSAANVWLGPNSAVRDPLAIWAGDGTSGAYLWGAQLEQRSFATAYTPTTTAPITNYIPVLQTASAGTPRFDHNPITGESLGLLIEEQRTNLLVRSQEFDNASWVAVAATVSANAAIAPDGTLTAEKLVANTSSSAHGLYQLASVTNATTYAFSIYAKAGEYRYINIGRANATGGLPGNGTSWYLDLLTGTITGTPSWSVTATLVGNGWYRITGVFTATSTSGGDGPCVYVFDNAGNGTYTGNGFSGIYLWGAQLEAGAFATSYIPTVASQVTRAADSASMTGTNFSSWYNQSEGTVYTDVSRLTLNGSSQFNISDGTNSNYIQSVSSAGGTNEQAIITSGGTLSFNYGPSAALSAKLAMAYKTNDSAGSLNGAAATTDTSVTIPAVNQLSIGNSALNNRLNGTIKKLAYYPRRLTNTQLQALTS